MSLRDSEMDVPPPAYSDIEGHREPVPQEKPSNLTTSNGALTSSPGSSSSQANHRFPQHFGFYHAEGSYSNLMIALHAEDPMLWYISTHHGLSSQPSIVLHTSPNPSAPPLATVDFHAFSTATDVVLFSKQGQQRTKFEKAGAFSGFCRTFQIHVPQTDRVESFEWKRSRGGEVAMLNGRSQGYKLVRSSNQEIVAAFARPGMSARKKGKMTFLAKDRSALGEDFELLAVMSMLTTMEKVRRNNNGAAAGGGGGGGGA